MLVAGPARCVQDGDPECALTMPLPAGCPLVILDPRVHLGGLLNVDHVPFAVPSLAQDDVRTGVVTVVAQLWRDYGSLTVPCLPQRAAVLARSKTSIVSMEFPEVRIRWLTGLYRQPDRALS